MLLPDRYAEPDGTGGNGPTLCPECAKVLATWRAHLGPDGQKLPATTRGPIPYGRWIGDEYRHPEPRL